MAESEDKDDLLEEIMSRYKAAREHASKWREGARECYEFYSGRHWTEEEIEKLTEEMRPPIVFNRAAVLIDAVLGYETNNRQETRYIPRTQGDAKVNEMLSGGADFFRDQCDAEYHESDAFRDCMICGMGWTGDRISDETNAEYDLIRERVDPFEMLWDPSAKEPNLADGRYLFRTKRFDRGEVKALFPEWDGEVGNVDWILEDDMDGVENSSDPRLNYKTNDGERSPNRDIPVIEYQYKTKEPIYLVAIPNEPKPAELTPAQYKKVKGDIEAYGLQVAKKQRSVFKRVFLIGGAKVKEDSVCPHHFTYHCITGKRDRNKSYWLGIMAAMLDPQKWSNKWLSQILHVLNSAAKPGYDVEKSAIVDQAKFEKNASKPGAINVFSDGALQKGAAQYRNPPPMPTGHERLLEYANDAFTAVTGVNQEIMGLADREQAGVLEFQRKQSAVTLLAPLFDSLRRYRKMAGRTWLYLMTKYMSDGRLIRITQDDQEQSVPFDPHWRDEDVSKYDVIVDQAATSPNQKEATWAVLQTLMPVVKDMLPPPVMMLFLEYSPMPESLVEKMKQTMQNMPPPPDPEQQKLEIEKQKMAMQMDMKRQELEMKKEQARLDAQIEWDKAQQEMEIEARKAENQLKIEMIKADNQIKLDMHKGAMQIELQRSQGQQEMAMDRERFGFEADQAQQKMNMDRQAGEQQLTQKAAMADQALRAAKSKAKLKPKERTT